MAQAPLTEIDSLLMQLRDVLLSWDENATLGEVAIVGGGHEWQIEERPRHRGARIKRATRHVGYAEKVCK